MAMTNKINVLSLIDNYTALRNTLQKAAEERERAAEARRKAENEQALKDLRGISDDVSAILNIAKAAHAAGIDIDSCALYYGCSWEHPGVYCDCGYEYQSIGGIGVEGSADGYNYASITIGRNGTPAADDDAQHVNAAYVAAVKEALPKLYDSLAKCVPDAVEKISQEITAYCEEAAAAA